MISLSELLDLLEAAERAAASGDEDAFAAHADAFVEGIGGTAGAVGSYEADYILRDLAAALEAGEPAEAGALRIRAALERLRDVYL